MFKSIKYSSSDIQKKSQEMQSYFDQAMIKTIDIDMILVSDLK